MRSRLPALLLLFLPVLLAGCGGEPRPLPPSAAELSAAEARYLGGDYAGAEGAYRQAALAGDPAAAGWWGRILLKLERYLDAERAFRMALEGAGGRLAAADGARARLGLADAILAEGRPAEAMAAYTRVLLDPEALRHLDPAQVTYKAGIAGLRAGLWEEAEGSFHRLTSSWPESPFAAQARQRLEDAASRTFSIQHGAFATAEAADRFLKKLTAEGIGARVVVLKRGADLLYAVRSGSFPTYEEASRAAGLFRVRGREGVVVP